jgi:hypothetical protein
MGTPCFCIALVSTALGRGAPSHPQGAKRRSYGRRVADGGSPIVDPGGRWKPGTIEPLRRDQWVYPFPHHDGRSGNRWRPLSFRRNSQSINSKKRNRDDVGVEQDDLSMEGSAAVQMSVPREGYPHPPASAEREVWRAGWYEGAAISGTDTAACLAPTSRCERTDAPSRNSIER